MVASCYDLKQRFLNDFSTFCKKTIAESGFGVPSTMSSKDIIECYYKMQFRLIRAHKRKVVRSDELIHKMQHVLSWEICVELDQLQHEFENGYDVTPRLSRTILDITKNDLMLNDFGIHHFHYGNIMRKDGLINSTAFIVYARITDDVCYMIDILPHGHWSDKRLLEILRKNWPNLLIKPRSKIKPCSPTLWGEEREKMRKSGLNNNLIMFDDGEVFWAPGFGYFLSGASIEAGRNADKARNHIVNMADELYDCFANKDNLQGLELRVVRAQFKVFDKVIGRYVY